MQSEDSCYFRTYLTSDDSGTKETVGRRPYYKICYKRRESLSFVPDPVLGVPSEARAMEKVATGEPVQTTALEVPRKSQSASTTQEQTPENSSAVVATNEHDERAHRYRYSQALGIANQLGSDGREETSNQRKEVKRTSHTGGETTRETVWQKNGCSWEIRSITTIEKDHRNVIVHRETRDAHGNLRR